MNQRNETIPLREGVLCSSSIKNSDIKRCIETSLTEPEGLMVSIAVICDHKNTKQIDGGRKQLLENETKSIRLG
jgi:hypothetical protein